MVKGVGLSVEGDAGKVNRLPPPRKFFKDIHVCVHDIIYPCQKHQPAINASMKPRDTFPNYINSTSLINNMQHLYCIAL